MALESTTPELVYVIERQEIDFYDIDIAKRLISAEEMAERVAEEMRTAKPLTLEEMRLLEEGGCRHAQDPTRPSAWNGWLLYERLDGRPVKCPPTVHPQVTELSKSAAIEYVLSRYESELERHERSLASLTRALKSLGVAEDEDVRPFFERWDF